MIEQIKLNLISEYRIENIEDRITKLENKVNLLIDQLKIEFYKKDESRSR